MQKLSVNLDWLGVDKDESDHASFGTAIDPIVDRAALHEHIAGFQMNDRVVELHIDLARHDDGIIDGKTVPFFNVVPTLRSPSSASPVLSIGKDSEVQTTQDVEPGRAEV